jgi:biopolymer transport protein ExbB/TolQ
MALVLGLLGQLIGLYSAFRALTMGEAEASIVLFVSGFKISMVTSIYGLLIFCCSMIIWFLFKKAIR